MTGPASIEVIRTALTFIEPEDRELWVKIGMALKSELGDEGIDTWDAWSQRSESYRAKDVLQVWRSMKGAGGVKIGTLFHEAKQRGFLLSKDGNVDRSVKPDKTVIEAARKQRIERERAEHKARETAQHKAAQNAQTVFGQASETGASPYLERKKIRPYGVRFDGEDVLVPMFGQDGSISNLQRILARSDAHGRDKFFLPGGRVSGCLHWLGKPALPQVAAPWLLIAEGYATAATLHEATGRPVATAFNAGNMLHIAEALRLAYPEARLLLCADDDQITAQRTGKNPGIEAAKKAAHSVRGTWIAPQGLPEGATDFNDLANQTSIAVVREQVEQTIAHAATQSPAAGENEAGLKGDAEDEHQPLQQPKTPKNKGEDRKPYFISDDSGVWYIGTHQDGSWKPKEWVCSPLAVVAHTRDRDEADWGYLLTFPDPLSKPKQWAMPARMLAGDGNEYRQILLSLGLRIDSRQITRSRLTQYLQESHPEQYARCSDTTGWHGRQFVLPDRTLGENGERVIFQSAGNVTNTFKQAGALDDWRTHIGRWCAGNSRLLFAVSCAFAGPLLHITGLESGGFHLRGGSSSGKTTALRLAASVFGGEDFMQRWRATDNALEAIAGQHSDTLLVLDEINQADGKMIGECTYLLANQKGKARAQRTGLSRPVLSWRLLFLSAGEIGLAEHMAEVGKKAKAGQEVRMADIQADAGTGFGLFDTVHDYAGGGAGLSKHLASAARKHYGTAGIAFLQHCVQDHDDLSAHIKAYQSTFMHDHLGKGAAGQAERVAGRFALVAAAGELATAWGITGWAKGEASQGVARCYHAWLDARGGDGDMESRSMLQQVRDFLQRNGEARFAWLHRIADDHRPNVPNLAGYRKLLKDGSAIESNHDHYKEMGEANPAQVEGTSIEHYVLKDVFEKEVCAGHDHRQVSRLLLERGFIKGEKNGEFMRPDRKERLPVLGSMRVYRFSTSIFDADL